MRRMQTAMRCRTAEAKNADDDTCVTAALTTSNFNARLVYQSTIKAVFLLSKASLLLTSVTLSRGVSELFLTEIIVRPLRTTTNFPLNESKRNEINSLLMSINRNSAHVDCSNSSSSGSNVC
jgi:hypothetical protein